MTKRKDHYLTIPVVLLRSRLDALHAARKVAGLSAITDSQMVHQVVRIGEVAELESLTLLAEEGKR